MHFDLITTGRVKYCPSVIDSIDDSLGSYIIGCYQLIGEGEDSDLTESQLEDINQRLGCLVYIDLSTIKFVFDCPDGGVFDLKVVKGLIGSTGQECNPQFWAAHSNGTVACYEFLNETITLIQRIPSGSSMLCSLAICDPDNGVIISGDFDSKIVACKKDKIISHCKVTNSFGDPIWCLNSIQCYSNTFIIFSGSEDSQLRINLLQSETFSPTLKTIKDFSAGVTSIAFIKNPDSPDDDVQNQTLDYIVYIGSYDETVRVYQLAISLDDGEQLISSQSIKLTAIQSIHINGSGIWKIIPIQSDQQWPYMLTASMYAGAHIIQKQSIETEIKLSVSLNDKSNDICSNNHLVYGVSGTVNCNQLIVTSFYDKSFHIFRRCF